MRNVREKATAMCKRIVISRSLERFGTQNGSEPQGRRERNINSSTGLHPPGDWFQRLASVGKLLPSDSDLRENLHQAPVIFTGRQTRSRCEVKRNQWFMVSQQMAYRLLQRAPTNSCEKENAGEIPKTLNRDCAHGRYADFSCPTWTSYRRR